MINKLDEVSNIWESKLIGDEGIIPSIIKAHLKVNLNFLYRI